MAGFLFDEFRKSIGGNPSNSQGMTDWQDGTIGAWFVDHGTDTPSQSADVDAADRTGFNPTFANAPNLSGKTSSISSNVLVLDATDTPFSGAAQLTGSTSVESYELFVDTGTNTTSNLISNHDDYTGLPYTPAGVDVTVVYHANGIIRI